MSDLISRSQLLKEIETWGGCVEALHEYIQNMPTAYDVDKVVEQLKTARDGYSTAQLMTATNDELVKRFIAKEKAMNLAIKIVKAGGNIELSEHSESQGNREKQ